MVRSKFADRHVRFLLAVGTKLLIRLRPFRNGDPPALAEIWCSHPPLRGLAQPVTPIMLEEQILSKPYFDRLGLIVAEEDGQPVGFAHAGFGPSEDMSQLVTETGVTCMLMVAPHPSRDMIADQLLQEAEQYLRGHGARLLYGGGIFPVNPFYLGLYGGSELPGVLVSDQQFAAALSRSGYREIDRTIVLHADLARFRPIVDRRQMRVRRTYRIETVVDPPADSWWVACATSPAEYTRYQLVLPGRRQPCGQVAVWNMEPLSRGWGVRAAGLDQVRVDPSLRREGLATYLLGETLRQLSSEGVSIVEVQAMQQNTAALRLYQKLGFQEVDQGIVYRKDREGNN